MVRQTIPSVHYSWREGIFANIVMETELMTSLLQVQVSKFTEHIQQYYNISAVVLPEIEPAEQQGEYRREIGLNVATFVG